jgi:hypothetical protein
VRIKHGVNMRQPLAQRLLAEIGAGIDDDNALGA